MCCPLLGPAERGALLSASVLDERQINDFNNSLATTGSALSEAGLSLDLLLALNAWRELTWYPAQDQELDHDHFLFGGGQPRSCCMLSRKSPQAPHAHNRGPRSVRHFRRGCPRTRRQSRPSRPPSLKIAVLSLTYLRTNTWLG